MTLIIDIDGAPKIFLARQDIVTCFILEGLRNIYESKCQSVRKLIPYLTLSSGGVSHSRLRLQSDLERASLHASLDPE